jgi:hypothetical protein
MFRTTGPSDGRTALAVLLVTLLAVSAGCTGVMDGGDGGPSGPATDVVPADVDLVAYTDVQSMRTDESLRDLTNTYLSLQTERSPYSTGPTNVSEFVEQIENETDLDVEGLESVTMFGRYPGPNETTYGVTPETEYSGAIVTTSWSEDELMSELENESDTDLHESTYAGATLYTEDNDTFVGALGDGRFVFGNEAPVKDVLDVAAGNADAASGDLLGEFEDTRDGHLRFASQVRSDQVPTDQLDETGAVTNANIFNEVEVVSGAMYTDGDTVGMDLSMTVGDGSTAENLRGVTVGAVSYARQSTNGTRYHTFVSQENMTVSRSDTTVTLTATNTVDTLETTLEFFYDQGA